jgi:hypothetical protein
MPPGVTYKESEFVFQHGFCLVELAGKKASNLKEFLKCIRAIDDESIFFHIYHTLRQHHFAIPEYSNDFAHWLKKELHEDVLAERFTYIRISQYDDIKTVKQKLIDSLKKRLDERSNGTLDVPEERSFHFVRARIIALPTEHKAKNLKEFAKCLEGIERDSIFYHFFSVRLAPGNNKGRYTDDFSKWISKIGHPEIADGISALNPYGYTLEGLREEILKIVRGEK